MQKGQAMQDPKRRLRWWRRGADRRSEELASLTAELDQLVTLMAPAGDREKTFLNLRWCAPTLLMKKKLQGNKQGFSILRVIAAVGAVIVPVLVGLNLTGNGAVASRWVAFGLSVLVAVTTTLLEVFRYGPRWKLYERSVDAMINEGWYYAEARGDYGSREPMGRFDLFVEQVETILSQYTEGYMHDVVVAGTEGEVTGPSRIISTGGARNPDASL